MKKLLLVVAVLIAMAIAWAVFMPRGHGCGSATVEVKTKQETRTIHVGLDSYYFFGKQIDSDDLVKLVKTRIKEPKGGPRTEEWRTTPYKKRYYKIDRAIDILIKIHHPEIRSLCTELLRDPYFCHRAVGYLVDIGGNESATAILYASLGDPSYPDVYINACHKLKDPRAIPLIINSIGPQYQHVQNKVKVIEEISGESLPNYVDETAHFQSSTDTLKMKLWTWWIDYKNRHNIKSI